MKKLIFISVICANVSQASIMFKSKSNLPLEVQSEISRSLRRNCPDIGSGRWNLYERATDVQYEVAAAYYTTDFSVYKTSEDGESSEKSLLKVETLSYQPAGPVETGAWKTQVQRIQGFCRP